MPPFTVSNVAKFAINTIVRSKATDLAKDTIVDHTKFEETDLTVKISSNMIGWFVGDKLQPHTDRVVDWTVDWYETRKASKTETE